MSESHVALGGGVYEYTYVVTNTSGGVAGDPEESTGAVAGGGLRGKEMRYAFKRDMALLGCWASILGRVPWACVGVVVFAIWMDPAGELTNEAVQFQASSSLDYMDPGESQTFVVEAKGAPGVIEYLYEFEDGSYVRGMTTGPASVGPVGGGVGGIAELPDVAETPLEAPASSGPSVGVLAGAIAGAVAVGGVTLGGAAWYVRRRWLR